MKLALFLALQTAGLVPERPPPALGIAPIAFDLARLRPIEFGLARRRCAQADGEILVCGIRPRGGGYPTAEMARLYEEGPLVAETTLFGEVQARAYVESVEFQPGVISNRIMVGIRFPF